MTNLLLRTASKTMSATSGDDEQKRRDSSDSGFHLYVDHRMDLRHGCMAPWRIAARFGS